MKKAFIYFTVTVLALLMIVSAIVCNSASKTNETVTISQKIGGNLICYYTRVTDFHHAHNLVEYQYQLGHRIYKIGYGTFNGRQWTKDEQLHTFGRWIILKTGGNMDNDKIMIASKSDLNKWSEYDFSPENIEKENVWKAENIKSSLYTIPFHSFVTYIANGFITVNYRYRIDGEDIHLVDERNVIYQINDTSGAVKMERVER